MIVELVPQLITVLWLVKASATAPSLTMPGCQAFCGSVSIPYPFGIEETCYPYECPNGTVEKCYHDEWFEITCNRSFEPPRPFLRKANLEVLNISLELQQVTVNNSIDSSCEHGSSWTSTDYTGTPFRFSNQNRFTVMGCENNALMPSSSRVTEILAGCTSICTNYIRKGCYGINCCQSSIPFGLDIYRVETSGNTTAGCAYAFLVDTDWLPQGNLSTPPVVMEHAPVVMEWMVPNTSLGDFTSYYCYRDTTRVNFLPV
ncbi:hypothetical protein L1049_007760 [Liquidambar formosana]|uniref:Wall-associated receptor kinase galacturonan-binding domain-containing protein n=1 Tax=Liquidambar formosana TaxID=63359 RepID=A0AAP0S4U6_LIQFO